MEGASYSLTSLSKSKSPLSVQEEEDDDESSESESSNESVAYPVLKLEKVKSSNVGHISSQLFQAEKPVKIGSKHTRTPSPMFSGSKEFLGPLTVSIKKCPTIFGQRNKEIGHEKITPLLDPSTQACTDVMIKSLKKENVDSIFPKEIVPAIEATPPIHSLIVKINRRYLSQEKSPRSLGDHGAKVTIPKSILTGHSRFKSRGRRGGGGGRGGRGRGKGGKKRELELEEVGLESKKVCFVNCFVGLLVIFVYTR